MSIRPVASPDGRRVAHYALSEGRWVIRVIPIDGGSAIGTFSLPANSPSRTLRWMPDGRAFAYIVTVDGVSNVWKQALEGGSPEPVTDFSSDRMVDFAWSRDGRLLAVMRAVETSDAVRITDFH
jgi:Tol biopolymer transport system component